jgi:hypothetical protein
VRLDYGSATAYFNNASLIARAQSFAINAQSAAASTGADHSFPGVPRVGFWPKHQRGPLHVVFCLTFLGPYQ